jgi:soluble lytic murein transglycosylase-like protein
MIVSPYRKEIVAAAAAHGLSPDLVEAITVIESSGKTSAYRYEPAFWARYMAHDPKWATANPERVSASYGLMQVMFPVAQEIGFEHLDPEYLFVPAIGLEFGCRKFASLLRWAEGDVARALAAYNGGQRGNVTPPFRNQSYADKVLRQLKEIEQTT